MCDLQTVMDTLKESAGAIKKVGSVAEKVFGAKWRKAQADAEAYAIDTIADTMRRNDDMKITYSNGAVSIEKKEYDRLLESARLREEQETVKQQKNIEAMFNYMIEELRKASKVSDEPVDEDFVDRLVENAKKTNKKELQFLWGKILAQEVVKPGSFSLRTLETVRNLSQLDMKTFEKITKVIFNYNKNPLIVADKKVLDNFGIEYFDILTLQECGVINPSGMVAVEFIVPANNMNFCYDDKLVVIVKNRGSVNKTVKLNVYKFTKAGLELLNVLNYNYDEKYMIEVSRCFREADRDINLQYTVHKINSISTDGNIHFDKIVFAKIE